MASHRSTLGPGSYYPGTNAPHGHEGGPSGNNNLSVADQLMQIDAAITSTLQEIDANFARAHQIVTATLLPAVKVYGQHSAKTWQSAKFWQEFFITAAQVPLKRADEGVPDTDDADYDAQDQTIYEPESDTSRQEQDAQYNLSGEARDDRRGDGQRRGDLDDSDDSARFFNSVKHVRASSPPNASRRTNANAGNDSEASWAPMESPFERLRKEVEADYSARQGDASMSQAEMRLARHRANREAREKALLDDASNDETIEVDRRDLAKGVGRLDLGSSTIRSPAKLRPGQMGTPKLLNRVLNSEQKKATKSRVGQNPFQQGGDRQAGGGGAGPSHWSGIADLRQTPLSTNKVSRSKAAGKKGASPAKDAFDDSDEDSLAWPPGMSPPVTLQFSIPQSKYLKTPAKEATKMFMEDLLRTAEAGPATIARRKLAAEQAMLDDDDSLGMGGSPSKGGRGAGTGAPLGAYKGKGVVGHSAVASPLKKGPLQKGGRHGDGPQKRRDSLPTPPTLTRTLPGRAAQAKTYDTPGSIAASGSLPGNGQAGHRAAMLLDPGEGGDGSDGDDDDDDDDGNMPELRPGPSASAFADVTPVPQGRRQSKPASAEDDSDSESDSDDDEDSEEDSRVGLNNAPLPASTSKNLSTFSSNLSHSHSEGTASSNSRVTAGGNLDNDTLFGVGKSSRVGGGAGAGTSGASAGDFRVIGGPLDNTVQGGKLLADKDITYSAPSPTPWKSDV